MLIISHFVIVWNQPKDTSSFQMKSSSILCNTHFNWFKVNHLFTLHFSKDLFIHFLDTRIFWIIVQFVIKVSLLHTDQISASLVLMAWLIWISLDFFQMLSPRAWFFHWSLKWIVLSHYILKIHISYFALFLLVKNNLRLIFMPFNLLSAINSCIKSSNTVCNLNKRK